MAHEHVGTQSTQGTLAREYVSTQSMLAREHVNHGQKICRPFHFLAQFLFTTSETELDYCHQKVNVQVVSRGAERLKT